MLKQACPDAIGIQDDKVEMLKRACPDEIGIQLDGNLEASLSL